MMPSLCFLLGLLSSSCGDPSVSGTRTFDTIDLENCLQTEAVLRVVKEVSMVSSVEYGILNEVLAMMNNVLERCP